MTLPPINYPGLAGVATAIILACLEFSPQACLVLGLFVLLHGQEIEAMREPS